MKVRNLLIWILTVALLFGLTGCGGAATENSAGGAYYDAEMPQEEKAEAGIVTDASDGQSTASLPENRKLIRTIRMDAETEDMDPLLASLESKIRELDGYVENREVYNGSSYSQRRYRRAMLTIRIPADKVDGFVEHVGGMSNVVSSNESVEDITLQYVDTESRVTALKTEEERLLVLMEKAETLEDLLTIESRLTDVRYQLESYASRLRTYDNQVNYATVHLEVSEVQEYTPVEEETVWQRISGGFMNSLKGIGEGAVEFIVWLLSNLPYLVLYGAIGTGIGLLIRKIRKKKPRKAMPEAKKSPFAPKENPPQEKSE